MTADENAKAWRVNIKSKGQEIQSLIDETLKYLPQTDEKRKAKFDETLATLTNKSLAMRDLYGPNLAPERLEELIHRLHSWKSDLRNPVLLRGVVELHGPIGDLNGTQFGNPVSFTDILERYKNDQTLLQYLDQLIAALEHLLSEGDETLTNQAAKELDRILAELKARKSQSIFDIQPWVDFALISTAAVLDHFTDTPLATIAAAAVIAAKESQSQIHVLTREARNEYIESLRLKANPKLDSPLFEKLSSATVAEVKNAIEHSSGLASLSLPTNASSDATTR